MVTKCSARNDKEKTGWCTFADVEPRFGRHGQKMGLESSCKRTPLVFLDGLSQPSGNTFFPKIKTGLHKQKKRTRKKKEYPGIFMLVHLIGENDHRHRLRIAMLQPRFQ